MRSHKYWIGTLTLGALLALSIIIPRAIPSDDAEAVGGTPFDLTADCVGDLGDCVYPAGTTSITVDLIATNNSGADTNIGSFQLGVLANQLVLNPPAVADATSFNANPNFNESLVPAGANWNCSFIPATNDLQADPAVAESFVGCLLFTGGPIPFPAGTGLTIATITYNVVTTGTSTLLFRDTLLADALGIELLNCAEPGAANQTGGLCDESLVTIGDPPTATPTPTEVAADTATPTEVPTNTPTNVPTNTPTQVTGDTATPTEVVADTATPTNTPTEVAADTATPTNTPTQVPTSTPTEVGADTATPTEVAADTATSTPTQVPTNTPTSTNTPTPAATPTTPAGATNTPTHNPDCAEFQYALELKIDPLSEGEHTSDDGYLTVTIDIITFDDDDPKSFNWTSNVGVDFIIVKGGQVGNNFYGPFDPEATSGTGLTTPGAQGNAISHVTFCYDIEATPTPTNTSVPTSTPTTPATATKTVVATTTAAVTTTVVVTTTPAVTTTAVVTTTPTTATVTTTKTAVPTTTTTSTPTSTPTVTNTPTPTATATTQSNTSTPTATATAPTASPTRDRDDNTRTPTNTTSTPVATTTSPATTPTTVSTVLAARQTPTGGSLARVLLPNTGDGDDSNGTGYLLVMIVLGTVGAGLVGAVTWRKRRA